MRKRIFSLLLVLSMLLSFMPVVVNAAYTGIKYGDYLYYQINSDNTAVTITDCDNYATEVVIPREIDGLPVTNIDNYAFADCSSLTSVTIPDSVTSIGWQAFSNCSSLTSVIIPDSVTDISDYAFDYCTRLTNISVNPNNQYYSSIDGNLYNKDKTELIRYAIGKNDAEFIIPNGVKNIGWQAFSDCSSLTSVIIPDSVTDISASPFDGCSSLTNISVNSNNQYYSSIDGNLYNKDKTELIEYAIGKNDTEFIIPNGVQIIGYSAFNSCRALTSITIPDSVTSIDDGAFWDCSGLTSVIIPNNVTSIGYSAFSGCSGLTNISVNPNNQYYSSIDGNLYNKDKTELIEYAIGKNDTEFIIPDGVKNIGSSAFSGCSSLTSISIPKSVKIILYGAFFGCTNLSNIYFEGTEEDWKNINITEHNETLTENAKINYLSYNPAQKNNTDEVTKDIEISVYVDNELVTFDVPPQIINDRTMVPLRAIFEALGASVDWNQETKTVTSTKGDTSIKLTIDSNIMYVNSSAVTLDTPACIVDDRTLVPARAISEAYNAKVDWDGDTKTVNITSNSDK